MAIDRIKKFWSGSCELSSLGDYMRRTPLLLALAVAVAGCGGGGSSPSPALPPVVSPPAGPPPPPPPVEPPPSGPLGVTLSSTATNTEVNEGATRTAITFTATISGTAATPIVPNVSYDTSYFSSVTLTPGSSRTYTVVAETFPDMIGGASASMITFRLCEQSACINVHPATTVTHAVSIDVKLLNWSMYQRNASHNGFVHWKPDVTKFAKAWEWTTSEHARLGGIAVADGGIYVTAGSKAYRLNEATGAVAWQYSAPSTAYPMGPPGIEAGVVYAPAKIPSSSSEGLIRGLDAATGVLKTESKFESQSPELNGPSFFDGSMYFSQGIGGNDAYRYALPSGAITWKASMPPPFFQHAQTPAVDAKHVYHSSGTGMFIVDRPTGAFVARVPAISTRGGAGVFGAPVITDNGLILTTDDIDSSLIAINPETRTIAWRGPIVGWSPPVTRKNVIYVRAVINSAQHMSALDATTGTVLWSWPLPAPDTMFIDNPVLTENLLFVSSDRMIYAIDLTTHLPVWSYPAYGKLVLSNNFYLHILQVEPSSFDSKVTAIKLN